MKTRLTLLQLCFTLTVFAQPLHYGGCWLKDEDGRYFNPKGFVVIMEDGVGKFEYNASDYDRMVKYGANAQVIRVSIGSLSGIDADTELADYLKRIDARVQLASERGMKTMFKMTVYGLKGFNHKDWQEIYFPGGKYRNQLIKAWQILFNRYAHEPSVIGYDLLNEMHRPENVSYEDATQKGLIPTYIELIKQLKAISPNKWAIYQPLLVDGGDRGKVGDGLDGLPMWHLQMPKIYDRMIYAPHGYFATAEMHQQAVERHLKDAEASNAALMMGEWGRQTYTVCDTNLTEQMKYTRLYIDVASIFDKAGMGLIKAWFAGTRSYNSKNGGLTWSVFSDNTSTGTTERKYIMDVICRPYPLFMAGCQAENYGFYFTDRTFNMTFIKNDFPAGLSEIYIPEDRHYPDGFSVIVDDKVAFVREKKQLTGLGPVDTTAVNKKANYFYDSDKQRLIIADWGLNEGKHVIKIVPGIFCNNQKKY